MVRKNLILKKATNNKVLLSGNHRKKRLVLLEVQRHQGVGCPPDLQQDAWNHNFKFKKNKETMNKRSNNKKMKMKMMMNSQSLLFLNPLALLYQLP